MGAAFFLYTLDLIFRALVLARHYKSGRRKHGRSTDSLHVDERELLAVRACYAEPTLDAAPTDYQKLLLTSPGVNPRIFCLALLGFVSRVVFQKRAAHDAQDYLGPCWCIAVAHPPCLL